MITLNEKAAGANGGQGDGLKASASYLPAAGPTTAQFIQGRREGQRRKELGMSLAAMNRERAIRKAQLALLAAGLARPDRLCSANDIPADLEAKYSDGGRWVGPAVRAMAMRRLIEKAGHDTSARPTRHGGDVMLWRIVSDERVGKAIAELRQWLERNPEAEPDGSNSEKSPPPAPVPASLFEQVMP